MSSLRWRAVLYDDSGISLVIDPKPTKRIKRREQKLDREAAEIFGDVPLGFVAHHAISQQAIRNAGLGEDVRWDLRNRLVLPQKVHDRHHSRQQPIRYGELPASVFEFAAEHGFLTWLEVRYPR